MNLPISTETLKRSLIRMLEAGLIGALAAFVAIPVNLDKPKNYLTALGVGMLAGCIQGLKKLISGYINYDK